MKLAALVLILLAPLARAGSLTLEIQHLWNGQPIDTRGKQIETAAGESINITRLSYLISEPQLLGKGTNTASDGPHNQRPGLRVGPHRSVRTAVHSRNRNNGDGGTGHNHT